MNLEELLIFKHQEDEIDLLKDVPRKIKETLFYEVAIKSAVGHELISAITSAKFRVQEDEILSGKLGDKRLKNKFLNSRIVIDVDDLKTVKILNIDAQMVEEMSFSAYSRIVRSFLPEEQVVMKGNERYAKLVYDPYSKRFFYREHESGYFLRFNQYEPCLLYTSDAADE